MKHLCRWPLIDEMVAWLHQHDCEQFNGPDGEQSTDYAGDFERKFAHATPHEKRLAHEIQYFQGIASKHDPFAPLEPLKPGHMRMWSPRIEANYFKSKQ